MNGTGPTTCSKISFAAKPRPENGAERFSTQQQRQRAGRDETVQHAGQPDVPEHGRLEHVQAEVDRRRRSGADAQPVGVAEDVFEQQPDDRERREVRPQMSEPQVHEMPGHEPPILAAVDCVTLVAPKLAQLVAADAQEQANGQQGDDDP